MWAANADILLAKRAHTVILYAMMPTSDRNKELPSTLSDCVWCPRECHADRYSGRASYCRAGTGFPVAAVCTHRGEEPVISGELGICNVFFAHCNMQCRFCQNHQISRNDTPLDRWEMALSTVLSRIETILDTGINRVGFVSPSHVIPQMLSVMDGLHADGYHPIYIYNTNAYDREKTIRLLDGHVDVFLPDLKYMDDSLAQKLSDAPHYVKTATQAITRMYRLKGADLTLDQRGLVTSGLIIRHLVLPGKVANSKAVLRFIAEELSVDVHISLMAQYRPTPAVADHEVLGRTVSPEEYDEVTDELERLGFHRGWVQELSSTEVYVPDFGRTDPFEGPSPQ